MLPRLFVTADLDDGQRIELASAQAHYLQNVMRRSIGDEVKLFNGRHGEWRAAIAETGRGRCSVEIAGCLRPQIPEPDLWLCFAPVKRARIDYLIEKASELGVSALHPVLTERTIVERVNLERLQANALEAAEQSERLSVPTVATPVELARIIDHWPNERRLLLCDETGGGPPIADVLQQSRDETAETPWAILIGPEGGFSRRELDRLAALPQATAVGLGPRILRADTAALAALSIWQAIRGDWRRPTPTRWPDYTTAR